MKVKVASKHLIHLNKGNLAGADVAFQVADGDFSVMLQIALLTEDVMDAGHHFVPLVVVSIPGQGHRHSANLVSAEIISQLIDLLMDKAFMHSVVAACENVRI